MSHWILRYVKTNTRRRSQMLRGKWVKLYHWTTSILSIIAGNFKWEISGKIRKIDEVGHRVTSMIKLKDGKDCKAVHNTQQTYLLILSNSSQCWLWSSFDWLQFSWIEWHCVLHLEYWIKLTWLYCGLVLLRSYFWCLYLRQTKQYCKFC